MILINIILLYFIHITHTDDFPSTASCNNGTASITCGKTKPGVHDTSMGLITGLTAVLETTCVYMLVTFKTGSKYVITYNIIMLAFFTI